MSWQRHAERERWRNGGEWDESATKVAVGELPGGRWYVRLYGGRTPVSEEQVGRAYAGRHAERLARGTARRWMRTVGGAWSQAGKV